MGDVIYIGDGICLRDELREDSGELVWVCDCGSQDMRLKIDGSIKCNCCDVTQSMRWFDPESGGSDG